MILEHREAILLLWLLAPLVALFLLPLRKKRVNVASMVIWEQVLQTRAVKKLSRWVRILATIIIEACILVAIVLAAGKIRSAPSDGGPSRRVLIVDRSASMQVQEAGMTRFDTAKRYARELVASKGADQQCMIISALSEPEVTCGWTDDASALREAIDRLECSDAPADLKKALALAQSAADEQTEICLISDTASGLSNLQPAPDNAVFYRCSSGGRSENVGITAFDIRRSKRRKGEFGVFLRVRSNSDRELTVPMEITLNGRPLAAGELVIPAGGAVQKKYTFTAETAGPVKASLRCRDALAADNQAYGMLEGLYAGRVFLWSARRDPFLMSAIVVHSDVELFEINRDKVTDVSELGRAGDILIFDATAPAILPTSPNLVLINPQASNDLIAVRGRAKPRPGVRVRGNGALFAGVDWSDLAVPDAAVAAVPDWAEVLLESSDGVPLVLAGVQGGRKVLIFAFELSGTTFVTSRGYSVLLANILSWMLPQTHNATLAAGEPLDWPDRQVKKIILPDGLEAQAPKAGTVFTETHKRGYYTVEAPGETGQFGVSLLDEAETLLAGPETKTLSWLKEPKAVTPSRGQNIWYILAMAALALLLVEWFGYHYRYIE